MIDIEKDEEQIRSIVKSNTIETDETIEEIIRRLRPDADEDTVKYLASIGSDCGDGCWYWRTYCFVEKSALIDGVRVLDRPPKLEELTGLGEMTESDFYGPHLPAGRAVVITPTPCGYFDGDEWRWEVCHIAVRDGIISYGDYDHRCTAHTLDEAVRFAIDELNSERIYIARESV